MELFNEKSIDEAIEYVNFLKSKLHKFPKALAEYLKRNFFPEYRKYLHFP